MTGLHNSPSLSLEVQRSLEASDVSLEVQRQEFLTEARESENNSSLSERIAQELNGGVPLEENVRKQLEAHFNTDLSKVRIHTGGKAHELAKSANAIAFTTGKDIFFQSGKYDPNSSTGFELLAHETAHTIQQASGLVSPGVDASLSLEQLAKLEGQKAVSNKPNLEKQATNFNDFLLKPNLEPQPSVKPRTSQRFRATHATARGIQRQRAEETKVKPVAEINAIGLVFNPDGVNMYAKPNTSGKDKPVKRLAFNTKTLVIKEFEGGWYQISLLEGGTGYVNKTFMRVYKDDPGANLHQVTAGQSAIGIAEKYYRAFAQPGMDLRYFVNVLAHINPGALKKVDSSNWETVAFNQKTVIRVPGIQHALGLKDQVNDGSMTNGMYAKITNGMGRIGDIAKSVLESPQFMGEVLGELWQVIKPQLPQFIALTAALIAAEMAVAALAAAPEPTMITKVIAMLLQGAILLFVGYGAAVSLISAANEGATWIKTAWNANGKYDQVKLASKAFLRMVGSIALAVLAIMGVRGGLGKFKALHTKFKTKLPLVQEPVVPPITTQIPTQAPAQALEKPPGLESRGYQPKPGERTTTQAQYEAQQSLARLTKLLGEDTIKQIGGKLTQAQIEMFIKELGVAGTKQVVSKFGADAMAKYGATFFKNFKGVTSNTMRHLLENDGIKRGEIKGCHDKGLFLSEIAKWGNIISQKQHPIDARILHYTYKLFIRDATGKVKQPSQLLTGSKIPDKTVIDGLIANSSYWKNVGQLAIIRSIRNGTLDIANADFSASAFNLKIRGFYRNGEVQTFWIEW